MAYRRGESEMPAFDFEYDHAKAFGVKFQWNVVPVRIVGEDKVKGVEFACTESSGDGSAPHVFEGANFTIGCDMVIVALGQSKLGAMLATVCKSPEADRSRSGHRRNVQSQIFCRRRLRQRRP